MTLETGILPSAWLTEETANPGTINTALELLEETAEQTNS